MAFNIGELYSRTFDVFTGRDRKPCNCENLAFTYSIIDPDTSAVVLTQTIDNFASDCNRFLIQFEEDETAVLQPKVYYDRLDVVDNFNGTTYNMWNENKIQFVEA